VARAVNASVNGFNTIEDGGGFKRETKGGEMKARRRSVARNRWRRR
jgi:hypothetical protein